MLYAGTMAGRLVAGLALLALVSCTAGEDPDDELPVVPFAVAVISDTHIWPAPEDHTHTLNFQQVAQELQDHDPPVEMVVSTGDNVEDLFVLCEDSEDIPILGYYRDLVLDSYDIPVQIVLGNHDNRFIDTFQGTDCPNQRWVETFAGTGLFPAPYYAVQRRGFQFLILDGTDLATDHDSNDLLTLGEDQLAWLASQLEAGLPTVILAHQPISPGLEAGDDEHPLAQVITEYNDVIAGVLFGHRHRFARGEWAGVPIYETAALERYPEAAYHVLWLDAEQRTMAIHNEEAIRYDVEYGR